MEYQTIIDFWFNELSSDEHFTQSDDVDLKIQSFLHIYKTVVKGDSIYWRNTPEGALAEIIVLDQFSRNLFRGKAEAYTQDIQTLKLAQVAVGKGFDVKLPPEKCIFMYMPYMHSESKEIHEKAVVLFGSLGFESTLRYEFIHKEIIDRFGRYPHRNKILGRNNTAAEEKYLAENKESFF